MDKKELPVLYSLRMRAFLEENHLAGGEDIVNLESLPTRMLELLDCGMVASSKNFPDSPHSINIKIDPIRPGEIREESLLPVFCLKTSSGDETWQFLKEAFSFIETSFEMPDLNIYKLAEDLLSKDRPPISGASILLPSGELLILNQTGVRVTHFGIRPSLRTDLTQESVIHVAGTGRRFIEALQISSKVLSHPETVFEICFSDNPEYTTGYLSVRGIGYIRLPYAKLSGISSGGRIIGLRKTFKQSAVPEIVHYLTQVPILFTKRNPLHPSENKDDLLLRFRRPDE
ncbi:MAG: 6-carboxyhexanoate--CoA ligase [Leptospirales bacterium]